MCESVVHDKMFAYTMILVYNFCMGDIIIVMIQNLYISFNY